MSIELGTLETLILAILTLLFGFKITQHINFLLRYNIPTPVTGGLAASIIIGVLYWQGVIIDFDLTLRDILLLAFFSTIGLSARIKLLFDGGKVIAILMVFAVFFLVVQNFIGVFGASLMGLDPLVGLLAGSVTLSGGHGTGITYGEIFNKEYGLAHGVEIAMACATYGLVAAGLLGGPLAKILISRFKIDTGSAEQKSVVSYRRYQATQIDTHGESGDKYRSIMECILLITICIVAGTYLNQWLTAQGLILPTFVSCLFTGILIINVLEWSQMYTIKTKALALCSNISLDIFLAMSLMSLQLWVLADLAVPLIAILAIQTVLVVAYVYFIIFKVLGKDYDASVISAGYVGFALGATPTAIANMNTVTQNFGLSPKAFLVIPLIGAFFIDIANNIVLQLFLRLPLFN